MNNEPTNKELARDLLKFKIRLEALNKDALETAAEMGANFLELSHRMDDDGDKLRAWLKKNCRTLEIWELEAYMPIACLDDDELDQAGSIGGAFDLIDKKQASKEMESGQ